MIKPFCKKNWCFVAAMVVGFSAVVAASGHYVLFVLPFVLLLAALMIYCPYYFSLVMAGLVAVSVPLSHFFPDTAADIILPTEPFLFAFLVLSILHLVRSSDYDRSFVRHPVTVLLVVGLMWSFACCFASSNILVSFKWLLVRLWFVVFFYAFAYRQLSSRPTAVENWVRIFVLMTLPVIAYAIVRLFWFGAGLRSIAYWAANPFYKDHTSYGALLAMFLPFVIGFSFDTSRSALSRALWGVVSLFFAAGLVFSYSRAAWVSVIGAGCLFLALRLRRAAFVVVAVAAVATLSFADLPSMFSQNRQQSSVDELGGHLRSVSNITNDVSNLERINRWKAACRMFAERPLFGFGPGTYAFEYAPFQDYADKTVISTNAGDLGNAHSEYLGALAESGLPGAALFVALVAAVCVAGFRLCLRESDERRRKLATRAFLGLATYFAHGMVNNFLDTDKLSLPFWSFTAVIVFLDLTASGRTPGVTPGTRTPAG